jgi:hypothetical protein
MYEGSCFKQSFYPLGELRYRHKGMPRHRILFSTPMVTSCNPSIGGF